MSPRKSLLRNLLTVALQLFLSALMINYAQAERREGSTPSSPNTFQKCHPSRLYSITWNATFPSFIFTGCCEIYFNFENVIIFSRNLITPPCDKSQLMLMSLKLQSICFRKLPFSSRPRKRICTMEEWYQGLWHPWRHKQIS